MKSWNQNETIFKVEHNFQKSVLVPVTSWWCCKYDPIVTHIYVFILITSRDNLDGFFFSLCTAKVLDQDSVLAGTKSQMTGTQGSQKMWWGHPNPASIIISALLQPLHLNKQWRNLYWKERKTRKNIHWINVLTCAMESLFAVESLVALGALASLYWTNWCELMAINDLLFLLFGILLFILFLFVLFLDRKKKYIYKNWGHLRH